MFKSVAFDDNQVLVDLQEPPRGFVHQSCYLGRLNCDSLTCQQWILLFHCLEVTSNASSCGDHTALGNLCTQGSMDIEDFHGKGFAFLCHLPQWCRIMDFQAGHVPRLLRVAGQRGKNKLERRKRRTKRKNKHRNRFYLPQIPPMNFCAAGWRGQQRNPYNQTTTRTEGRTRQDSATHACPKTTSKVHVVGLVQWSVDTKNNDQEDKKYVPTRRGMEPPREGRAPSNHNTKAAQGQCGERQSDELMTMLRVRQG